MEVVDVVVPAPTGHDVVVRIQACGVCHTDMAYREGGINDDFPFLLGHEAAGVVEAIGDRVTHVSIGDFVVLELASSMRTVPRVQAWSPAVLLRHI